MTSVSYWVKCTRCKNYVSDGHKRCPRCREKSNIYAKSHDKKTRTISDSYKQKKKNLGIAAVLLGLCKSCHKRSIYTGHSKNYCEHCFTQRKLENERHRKANRSKIAASLRKYRKDNPDKLKLSIDKYKLTHKEELKLTAKNQKYKRRSAVGKLSLSDWLVVLDKYGHKCLWCGKSDVKLTIDHVTPISAGGLNIIDNVQPLCGSCNSKKHTKILDFRPFGSAIMEWT